MEKKENIKMVISLKLHEEHPMNTYLSHLYLNNNALYNAMHYFYRQSYMYCHDTEGKYEASGTIAKAYMEFAGAINKFNEEIQSGVRKGNLIPLLNKNQWKPIKRFELNELAKELVSDKYQALPPMTAQTTMFDLGMNWIRFAKANEKNDGSEHKQNGNKMPPFYKNEFSKARISNVGAVMKIDHSGEKYLQFQAIDGFDQDAEILKFYDERFQQIPEDWIYTHANLTTKDKSFVLSLNFKAPDKTSDSSLLSKARIVGVDLGSKNFATLTNNFGEHPILLSGGSLLSSIYLWNKQDKHYRSILTHGLDPEDDDYPDTSQRLENIAVKRDNRVSDYLQKITKYVIDYCKERKVDIVVVGYSYNRNLKMQSNKDIVAINHKKFAKKLEHKAKEAGIIVIHQDESFSSIASFIDQDYMPKWYEWKNNSSQFSFSGTRVQRGLYMTKDGLTINADVNGSANIIRKAFPNMEVTKLWIEGVLKSPERVKIA